MKIIAQDVDLTYEEQTMWDFRHKIWCQQVESICFLHLIFFLHLKTSIIFCSLVKGKNHLQCDSADVLADIFCQNCFKFSKHLSFLLLINIFCYWCQWYPWTRYEHQRWISGNVQYICLHNANKAEPTLALKPRGYITRNAKQGYQWPQKRTHVHPHMSSKSF